MLSGDSRENEEEEDERPLFPHNDFLDVDDSLVASFITADQIWTWQFVLPEIIQKLDLFCLERTRQRIFASCDPLFSLSLLRTILGKTVLSESAAWLAHLRMQNSTNP